jgi:Pvc16 N-terminal domain
MSDFRSIAAVTATLTHVLNKVAGGSGSTAFAQNPDSLNDESIKGINVFLYQVTPNAGRRNADLPTRNDDGELTRRPRFALDLHYLFSFYGDTTFKAQELLGRAAAHLHSRPLLTSNLIRAAITDDQPWSTIVRDTDLPQQAEPVRLTPSSMSLEDLSKLWSILFQTPYRLSVAYDAGTIFLDGDVPVRPVPAPVQRREFYLVPTTVPRVDRVVSADGDAEPITVGSTLRILGSRLSGDAVRVSIDGEAIVPAIVSEFELRIEVAAGAADAGRLPASILRAGLHAVSVSHAIIERRPPEKDTALESNPVSFALLPRVDSVATPTPGSVSVRVEPVLRKGQKAVLRLLPTELDGRAGRAVERTMDEDAAEVEFAVTSPDPGEYFVRLQVDSVFSPLAFDRTRDPTVQL